MRRISVVVPSYNRAELLKLTVQSILAQTVRPFEIIIVDDGSTDHTSEVCATFEPPVRYMRQENSGVGAARNTGIRAAQGDWIAFCDSDDLWMPQKLELQLAAIDATGAGWSITDFGIIDPEGVRVSGAEHGFRRAFPVFSETGFTTQQHFSPWLDASELKFGSESIAMYTGDAFGMLFLGNVVIPSTSIVARQVVESAGPFDESFRVAEDTEFFHRVAAYARLTVLMKPLSEYRVGHPSLVGEKSEQLIRNAIRSVERAALLRPKPTEREQAAFREGARMLRERLAYARLTALDRAGARQALRDGSQRFILSGRSVAIVLASLIPAAALRALHAAKRVIRSIRR